MNTEYSFKFNQKAAKVLKCMIATSLISGVNGIVSCTSSSPQCCWVTFLWQKFGKTATVNSNGCSSSIPNVIYSGSVVTAINWAKQGLQNSIPPEICKLTSLQNVYTFYYIN